MSTSYTLILFNMGRFGQFLLSHHIIKHNILHSYTYHTFTVIIVCIHWLNHLIFKCHIIQLIYSYNTQHTTYVHSSNTHVQHSSSLSFAFIGQIFPYWNVIMSTSYTLILFNMGRFGQFLHSHHIIKYYMHHSYTCHTLIKCIFCKNWPNLPILKCHHVDLIYSYTF